MKNKVEAIIFDLGGVLLNIDYEAPVKAFQKLGVTDFRQLYSQAQQTQLFDNFETGHMSPQMFRKQIRDLSSLNLTDSEIDEAWNSILLDFPEHRVNMLTALKPKHKLILLSNTNEIHIHAFEKDLIQHYGKNVINELFQAVHYSSRLGMRKPHVETFQRVISLHHLNPQTTFFIDDSEQHVEGAKKAGLQAYWLNLKPQTTNQKGLDIVEFMANMGCI